jgi:hypothetical protein
LIERKLSFIRCGIDAVVVDGADAGRVDDGRCAMASPRALLASPKCVADVDEIVDLERELPHTEAR